MIVEIVGDEEARESPWIRLRRKRFRDADGGKERAWDYVALRHHRDVAVAFPRFSPSGDVLIIRQFRIVPERHVWGFPAGLVETGEDPVDCALRELSEETGYSGSVVWRSPPLPLNASLLAARAHIVGIRIPDDTTPADQRLDRDEIIEAVRLPRDGCARFLLERAEAGDLIGAGLFYALVLPSFGWA